MTLGKEIFKYFFYVLICKLYIRRDKLNGNYVTDTPPVVSPHVWYIPLISSHGPLQSDGVTGAWTAV